MYWLLWETLCWGQLLSFTFWAAVKVEKVRKVEGGLTSEGVWGGDLRMLYTLESLNLRQKRVKANRK